MASLIWLGGLYPEQRPVKAHRSQTHWNLDDDIWDFYSGCETPLLAFIAKGNIIEGVEAKT